tara:strand:- start:578 stop:754 length:177 start_codon:yes stop_codon:yes gene_type:complete
MKVSKVSREEILLVLEIVLVETNSLMPYLTEPWLESQKNMHKIVKDLEKDLKEENNES